MFGSHLEPTGTPVTDHCHRRRCGISEISTFRVYREPAVEARDMRTHSHIARQLHEHATSEMNPPNAASGTVNPK